MNAELNAIIEIGSTGIRLNVAEIYADRSSSDNPHGTSNAVPRGTSNEVPRGTSNEVPRGGWKVLDRAARPVSLGRDVFTSGVLSRESILECLAVLHNYRELLSGWGIEDKNIHVIATSALRAARNRDVFIDRIKQETGFNLSIVEGIEENRLMYLAVRFALKQDLPLFWRANSMIVEIGGGSTEIMLLRRGQMVAAHSLKMGTILIDQKSRHGFSHRVYFERYLNENIKNTLSMLNMEMDLTHVRTVVAAGSDARLAADEVGSELNENCRIIERDDFYKFVEKLKGLSIQECIQKFGISYADAEGLFLGLFVLKLFLDRTNTAKIVVPMVSIRDGYLIDLTSGVDSTLQSEFFSQIIASAVNLGRKFHFDEAHGKHVASHSMVIFDALVKEHGMNLRHRIMLETAAILHDIGTYIKSSGHQKHGQYIVANSEIFGLHQEELGIIANVINCHRGDPPGQSDIDFLSLQREDRVLVLKMASILRIADCLDRGHSQQIKKIIVERRSETVVLHVEKVFDLSMELMGLEEKGGMFQDVFGYKVVLS